MVELLAHNSFCSTRILVYLCLHINDDDIVLLKCEMLWAKKREVLGFHWIEQNTWRASNTGQLMSTSNSSSVWIEQRLRYIARSYYIWFTIQDLWVKKRDLHHIFVFFDDIGSNDQMLNLAGSFVNFCDSCITIMPFGGHLRNVSHSTANWNLKNKRG